jgi:alkanesulfonate monooxygenase SsuD/methylene tetrahydromethanopterin reductase-like flavin-dependent oxidoreductase (luciferase family)
MHFGQFNLMGYRTPGTQAHEIYDNAVEQVKAAEANGFEIAWFAEHHFSNYCVCPSPLMMLARLAGETKRIKLGSAVVVTPLYQPVRLISEIGMVDALTHGRLALGVGSGYQPYEFERFGETLEDAVPKLFEFMEMLELAFTRDIFSYSGKHYQVPETHIASPGAGPARNLGGGRQSGAAPARGPQGLDRDADAEACIGAATGRRAQPAGRCVR